ncbi:MAG: hypothetical protein ABEJ36_04585 [Candidatus Nanosalina sp.]
MALLMSASAAIPNGTGPEPEPPEPGELQLEPVNLTKLKTQFNKNTDRIPGFVGSLIGDQTIAINLSNVEKDRGLLKEDVIGIKMDGLKISEIQWGAFNETTLKIWIDQEDVNTLMESNQPLQDLKQMLKNGDIRYETYTFTNKIKMMLMQIFLMF